MPRQDGSSTQAGTPVVVSGTVVTSDDVVASGVVSGTLVASDVVSGTVVVSDVVSGTVVASVVVASVEVAPSHSPQVFGHPSYAVLPSEDVHTHLAAGFRAM